MPNVWFCYDNRFQSGFFFRHPLLDAYDYYWRLEPDVDYYCDIDYDVFKFMRNNGKKYGRSTYHIMIFPFMFGLTFFVFRDQDLISLSGNTKLQFLPYGRLCLILNGLTLKFWSTCRSVRIRYGGLSRITGANPTTCATSGPTLRLRR